MSRRAPTFLPGPAAGMLRDGDEVAFETKTARPVRFVGTVLERGTGAERTGAVYLYSPTGAFTPYRASAVRLLRIWREGKVLAEVAEVSAGGRQEECNTKLWRLRAACGK